MVYSAINDGLGLATSTNLVDWTEATGNPILEIGDVGAESWEKERIAPCEFLYIGGEAGHSYDFWIFYKGMNLAKDHVAVGVAKSNNMSSWTRDTANNPVVNWVPGWIGNARGVEDFRIQKMSTGNWMALYEADQSPTGGAAIGAASTTQTLPHSGWSDEGQVMSSVPDSGNFVANPTVIRREINGSTYYISVYERDGAATHAYGMYALESDIFNLNGWTQMSNPVIASESGWESNSVVPNGFICFDGKFYVYYTGSTSTSKQIGLAISNISYAYTKNCGVGGVGMRARADDWWVYENWKVRPTRALVHYGKCRYCNHGKGIHGKRRGRGPMIGSLYRWHGPFTDSVVAMDFARGLGRAETHICDRCLRYVRD